ncbi:hypothetical protein [Streptomyces canus]|uniref:hypothetical protein n=1 Tax=Streptomyces canus TaxID=58343 RepID=UPI002781ECEC|nr:hypothetical protein [Streptomyces canus]MDQ0761718.1 hypothetical protein [Streptomyces canus]MDQ1069701.1 hypothetical protein [Streptomyces canus]
MTTATAPVHATDQDRHAWVAPLIATILLVLLGPPALLFGGLSAMAGDSCGPDGCPSALTTSVTAIYATLGFGILVTLPALVASWALPWHRRWSALRAWLAALAVLPPLTVLVLVFTLPMP